MPSSFTRPPPWMIVSDPGLLVASCTKMKLANGPEAGALKSMLPPPSTTSWAPAPVK